MKFLIAGFGSIGRRHFHNLLTLGERDILFYRSQKSTLPDDELAEFIVETDLHDALSHKPDAVIVSNPTALHLDVAIPAARAGCHLLLEKPISHNMDRVEELRDALAFGGGQTLVGFQFRYHPGLQKIHQLLAENQIGRILSVRAHWGEYLPQWHPWEDYRKGYSARLDLGGGVVLTLCHPLDYLRWLLGDISSLWAYTAQSSDLELSVEDTAEIGLRFVSGVVGSVHLDYNQRPASHNLEIVGTCGTIRWNGVDGIVLWSQGSDWKTFDPPRGFERNDLFLAQMKHFLDVLRKGEIPVCSLEDGIKVLEIALAVQGSSQNGVQVRFV
jgi:predicted dehydrogenase